MSNNCELSIIIPSRNEMFLVKTIEDILENIEADTEIIVTLDGEWSNPPIPQHPRVNVIYVPEAIGQRAAQNIACRAAKGKFVMKVDAHCAFDKGFDRKMIEAFKPFGDENVTMVPLMRNLWAFDWKCKSCGKKWYQDVVPTKCDTCGGTNIVKKMVWMGKPNPVSWSYSFNSVPTFCYFGEYKNRPGVREAAVRDGLTETMSLQGSCFMSTRENYWKYELCDETLGSWGNQGIEVAGKTWLSGGKVLVNHRTWYAHLFRTKTQFGFPWPLNGRKQKETKENVKNLLYNRKYSKQIYPMSWLVERFLPVDGWDEKSLKELKEIEK